MLEIYRSAPAPAPATYYQPSQHSEDTNARVEINYQVRKDRRYTSTYMHTCTCKSDTDHVTHSILHRSTSGRPKPTCTQEPQAQPQVSLPSASAAKNPRAQRSNWASRQSREPGVNSPVPPSHILTTTVLAVRNKQLICRMLAEAHP